MNSLTLPSARVTPPLVLRWATLPLLALVALTLLPSGAAGQSMGAFSGSVQSFYTMPTSGPAAPGTLIRYQRYTDSRGVAVLDTYRVMYWSTMTHTEGGETLVYPLPVTGVVRIPSAAMPDGGFPTLVFEHGTVGVIARCGPSRSALRWQPWMLGDRFKTVAPDYPGLGLAVPYLRSSDADHWSPHPWYGGLIYQRPFDETTHAYISMSGEGRSSLDLVRAAGQLEYLLASHADRGRGAGASPDFVAIGTSQGGQAALATAELMAADYAPELNLLAVAAGAPTSTLEDVTTIAPELVPGFFALTLTGASLEFGDIHPAQELTVIGQANYQRTSESLCGDLTWFVLNAFTTYQLERPQAELVQIDGYFEFAEANSPGHRPVEVPVLVGQVRMDPLIDSSRSDRMVARLRDEQDAEVTYCVYEGNGSNDAYLGFENHTDVTARLYDGQEQRCTLPDGSEHEGTSPITAIGFFAAAGFPIP